MAQRSGILVGAVLAGGFWATSLGAESALAGREPEQRAALTALEAAKREFSELKSARGSAAATPSSKTIAPGAGVELRLETERSAPTLALTPREAAELQQRAQRSRNWLIEGVNNEAARDARNARNLAGGRSRREVGALEADGSAAEDGAADFAEQDKATDRATAIRHQASASRGDVSESPDEAPTAELRGVVNPLSGYMAGWMTPQDFDLLGVGAAKAPDGGLLSLSLPTVPAPPAQMGPPSAWEQPGLLPGADFGRQRTRDNPYLTPEAASSPWALPALTVSAPEGKTSPGSAPAVAPAPMTVERVPVPPPALTDRFKPSDDAKYFKQLKRF